MALPKIVQDTLMKKNGDVYEWSRTSLTMFIGFCFANYMALYDLWNNGFNYEVFLTYIGVAGGMKIVDGISKKLGKDTITNPSVG